MRPAAERHRNSPRTGPPSRVSPRIRGQRRTARRPACRATRVSAPLPVEASRQPAIPAIPPLSNHIPTGPTELRSVADKQRLRTHPAACTVQHLFGPALRQVRPPAAHRRPYPTDQRGSSRPPVRASPSRCFRSSTRAAGPRQTSDYPHVGEQLSERRATGLRLRRSHRGPRARRRRGRRCRAAAGTDQATGRRLASAGNAPE
jgi:hypothetical protein